MKRHAIMLCLAATALTACAGGQSQRSETGRREPIPLRDEDDACGASLVQNFVTLRANDALRAEIATRSGTRVIRWIAPGSAVTMDFNASRLNAELDEDGVIRALRCG